MASLTILYWRDIPAQVVARAGRQNAKVVLSERFEKAIDRAAMKAGLRDTDSYLAHWHRGEPQACEDNLEAAVQSAAAQLERDYDTQHLQALIDNGGLAVAHRADPVAEGYGP
ncbi:virulence factor [Fodinicurvata sediminis]|uniref:virulence factor n=1 Tax=Fodinicurvata sediminis TaxID=1121832 RepID=UPI0003B4FCF3|nr:virulence factor [Fodinicurvata sediminis]